ncbi:MAG: hypothetical protein RLZZ68_885 [Bacteroidota bacterium]
MIFSIGTISCKIAKCGNYVSSYRTMRIFCLFCIAFLPLSLWGQVIAILTLDKQSLEPIPNAEIMIQWNDSLLSVQSDMNGKYTLWMDHLEERDALVFSVQHPMYDSQTLQKIIFKNPQDTLEVKILLKSIKRQNQEAVTVKSPGIPDTVFNSTDFHVADFEINENGDYVLLVYPRRTGHQNSIFLFDGNSIIDSLTLNAVGINLIKDYRNNLHVICQETVVHVNCKGDSLLLNTIPKKYFLEYVLPIVDSTTSKYFFSNFNEYYPAFDYFSMDNVDSAYRKIVHIEDTLMMELYRSEYKWVDVRTRLWAKQKEIETGIDAQIWVGANYFTQSIYYKVPYAPLFRVGDSVYVFDFPSDKIWVYNPLGELKRSMGLYFHYHKDRTGWRRNIIKDPVTGVLYAVFEKDGITHLGNINLINGQISTKHRIHHKYVEKIRVNAGFVYYIYRPFESIQKRFLYKERLFN